LDTDAPTNVFWTSLVSSADGHKLIAAAQAGGIYVRQTTPTPALHVTRSGNQLLISWPVPSMKFVLEENSSLSTANWSPLSAPLKINYTNLNYEATIPILPSEAFYRLTHSPSQ
jgi:hypothetical protein